MGENVRRIEDWRREKGLAIQVLHYALPSALSAWWSRLQGRRILIHHNLTPARFFASIDPEMAEIVQRGENELRSLAKYTDLGLGDSEWNRQELEGFGYRKTDVLPILIDFSRYDVAPRPGLRKALADGMQNLIFV